ncbi:hydroxyacid dehydrogenase [Labrys sp. WJW]|uniref:2-hydroxyacid dehydrogenase n=1 Tax=Labrys sp. WJW TaxID=1737983 RepID=UPI0008337BF2|nr:2-hydroxyacid dehydrogenase [Labrys sp. WJW]OCC06966.1 hydroxyacid dehydrogenase [Labrys sp. WJW]
MTKPDLLMMGSYPDRDMEVLSSTYRLHKRWEFGPEGLSASARPLIRAIATRGDLGVDTQTLEILPHLEIIACYGVGVDAIDVDTARRRGIRVTNTPDVLNGDVADLAVGLALAAMRRIPAGDAHVRSGDWTKGNPPLAPRLHGKKLGIAGLGRIGATVARRFSGFDMDIGYFGRSPHEDAPHRFFDDLTALAAWADLLVLTLPGGAATQKIVGAEVLRALGPEGYLVNVSRGTTVDEEALLQALEDKTIAGAGLDVFWNEPHIDTRFARLGNVVLQPHLGSATIETRLAMGQLVRDNLAAHFAGLPLLTPVI